jgi:hypothetical protein
LLTPESSGNGSWLSRNQRTSSRPAESGTGD